MSLQPVKRTNDIIVESYNLFLNSDDGKDNGQNYDFQLGNNSINTRGQGQFIRLSLMNFNMYKNWTNVNPVNHGIVLRTNTGNTNFPIILNDYNYATIRDIATNLSASFKAVVDGGGFGYGATTITDILPPAGSGLSGTTDNLIGFTLNTTNPHGITAPDLLNGNYALQSVIDPANLPGGIPAGVEAGGDSGLLLGIDRTPASFLGTSFTIDISNPNKIVVLGQYPAQRFTEPNVYMRVNPAPEVFSSEMFSKPLDTTGDNQLNPSNILAEMRIDTEMIQYEPSNDRQYFANMYQKTLTHFRIALTDSRNRALPVFGANQTTLGNRHFTATIRVDIVQDVAYGENPAIIPESMYVKSKVPARLDSNVLIYQKNGEDIYGKPVHF